MVNWDEILEKGECYLYGVSGFGSDGFFRGRYQGYENGVMIFEADLPQAKENKVYVNPSMVVFVQKCNNDG